MHHNNIITDHLGNVFKSESEMCKYWNIKYSAYHNRKRKGVTLEEALTTPVLEQTTCIDHLGNVFKSDYERADFYGINRTTVNSRLKRGMSLEEALTYPCKNSKREKCTDHLGNVFNSKQERAEFYGIKNNTIEMRMYKGMSLEEALTTPLKGPCTDHLGNNFKSESERAEFYGLTICHVQGRMARGMTLEEALTTPIKKVKCECMDHLGNKFDSKVDMAKFYGTTVTAINGRLSKGMTLEEALTTSKKVKKYIDPVTGDELTLTELSKKYNITNISTIYHRLNYYSLIVSVGISLTIPRYLINVNQMKYNLTIHKRIKKGKDVFECYIDNGDGTSSFKIMTYDMIDQYCLEQYKKLHNIA